MGEFSVVVGVSEHFYSGIELSKQLYDEEHWISCIGG